MMVLAWVKCKWDKLIALGWPAFGGVLLLVASSFYFLFLSWGQWPDILVDSGRELFIPWQLSEGKVLYRDIFFYYGPFSKYLYAFFFKVFSPSLYVVFLLNFFFILVFIFTAYRLLRCWASRAAAHLSMGAFLALFAFGQYTGIANYNFVFPYAHELVHGFILACMALLCLFHYMKAPCLKGAFIIGSLVGLVFLTKVEVFVALSGSMLLGAVAGFLFLEKPRFWALRNFLCCLAGFLLPVVLFYAYFIFQMGFKAASAAFFFPYLIIFNQNLSANGFYKAFSGWDNPALSVSLMFSGLFWLVLVLAVIFMSAFFTARIRQYAVRILVAVVLLLAAIYGVWFLVTRYVPAYGIFRFLPLVSLIIATGFCLRLYWLRKTEHAFCAWAGMVFSIFSVLMLLKISLYGHIFHSGFILALPAVLVLVAVIFDAGSFWMTLVRGSVWMFQSLFTVLLLGVVLSYGLINIVYAHAKHYVFGSERGKLLTYMPQYSATGPIFSDVLALIKGLPEGSTVAVLPEGVTINFFSGHATSTRYFEFSPSFFDMSSENEVLNAFQKSPPDYIVLVDRDMSEHGAQYFGKDYAQRFYAWLAQNYEPLKLLGHPPFSGKGFGVLIARKIMLESS